MSIKALYEQISSSSIGVLKYEGKVLAFRAKLYNLETKNYDYYDFLKEFIQSQQIRDFINRNKDKLEVHDCIAYPEKYIENGIEYEKAVFMTKIEHDNNLVIPEFKSVEEAEAVLQKIIKVYNAKGVM